LAAQQPRRGSQQYGGRRQAAGEQIQRTALLGVGSQRATIVRSAARPLTASEAGSIERVGARPGAKNQRAQ